VPAIKPAAVQSRTGVIGLLGTEATIRQAYVDRLEAEFAQGKTLIRHGAGGLVALAEAKLRGEPVAAEAVVDEISGLLTHPHAENLDTVVLACTHFPLLQPELARAFGSHVRLVDGSEGIARRIESLTSGQSFARSGPDRAITTGSLDDWHRLAPALSRFGLARLETF
jgi:glutamate racemase